MNFKLIHKTVNKEDHSAGQKEQRKGVVLVMHTPDMRTHMFLLHIAVVPLSLDRYLPCQGS